MKEEIMVRLNAISIALDNISVKGKQNLANLYGCIGMLEDVVATLEGDDVVITGPAKEEEAGTADAPKEGARK